MHPPCMIQAVSKKAEHPFENLDQVADEKWNHLDFMWGREAPTLLFPQILEVGCSSMIFFQISAKSIFILVLWSVPVCLCPNLQIISTTPQAIKQTKEWSSSRKSKVREEPCEKNHIIIFRKPIGCTFLRENIHKICEVILAELFPSKQAKVELEHGKMVKN